jgi:hypothetical protein
LFAELFPDQAVLPIHTPGYLLSMWQSPILGLTVPYALQDFTLKAALTYHRGYCGSLTYCTAYNTICAPLSLLTMWHSTVIGLTAPHVCQAVYWQGGIHCTAYGPICTSECLMTRRPSPSVQLTVSYVHQDVSDQAAFTCGRAYHPICKSGYLLTGRHSPVIRLTAPYVCQAVYWPSGIEQENITYNADTHGRVIPSLIPENGRDHNGN